MGLDSIPTLTHEKKQGDLMTTQTMKKKAKAPSTKQTWVFEEMTSLSHDMFGKVLEKLISTWNGKVWILSKLIIYTYEDELITTKLIQDWDEQNQKWILAELISYDYDEDGTIIQELRSKSKDG